MLRVSLTFAKHLAMGVDLLFSIVFHLSVSIFITEKIVKINLTNSVLLFPGSLLPMVYVCPMENDPHESVLCLTSHVSS